MMRGVTTTVKFYRCLLPILTLIAVTCAIVACGGGGDEPSTPVPPPPENPVFFGDQINPEKWGLLHFVRKIENGELVSEISRGGSDGVNTVYRTDATALRQPSSFQVDVTVTEARNREVQVQAFLEGRFYTDTPINSQNPNDRTGEIIAQIDIRQEQDSADLVVGVFVKRCEDVDCNTLSTLEDNKPFGNVEFGEKHTLSIAFDGSSIFTFGFNERTFSFNQAPTVVSRSPEPRRTWGTSVTGIDPNADSMEAGFISARFDNLTLNAELKDDYGPNSGFNQRLVLVRQVINGKAILERNGKGERDNNSTATLSAIENPTSSIKAEVTIEDIKTSAAGAQFLLKNVWYRSGSDSNGATGDVSTDIRISKLPDDDRFGVLLLSFRCLNSDCTDSVNLFVDRTSLGPVGLGETHRISLSFDPPVFTFGFDDQATFFDPTDPVQLLPDAPVSPIAEPPGNSFTVLALRLFGLSMDSDEALIRARLDNIVIDEVTYDNFSPIPKNEAPNFPPPGNIKPPPDTNEPPSTSQ